MKAAFALATLCFSGCAVAVHAEEIPAAVDLMAIITAGVSDGSQIAPGPLATAKRTGPGAFLLEADNNPARPTLTVTEPSHCVFILSFQLPGKPAIGTQFDANLIRTFTITEVAPRSGLHGLDVLLEGEDGLLAEVTADGPRPRTNTTGNLATSLEKADIEAAVALFQQNYCPGPGA